MKQEVLINNLVGILYQGLFLISRATYIDKRKRSGQTVSRTPSYPHKQNKIYRYLKKEEQ